jgi:hypothetical protein
MSLIPTPDTVRQLLAERLSVVGQIGETNLAEYRGLLESLADGEWKNHGNGVESLHHYDQPRIVRFTFVHVLFDELKHQAAVIEEAIEQLVDTILNIAPEGSTVDFHLEHRLDVRNDEARDTPIVCHGYGIVRQLA